MNNPRTKRTKYICPGCGAVLGGKQGISGHAKNTPSCTPAARFWGRVDSSGGPDACWPWEGAVTSQHGYGNALWEGRYVSAHRIAWSLRNGPVPSGMCVLHKCDNRVCCNPAHFFLGTKKDNSDDKIAKDRHARGERNKHAKLTPEQVLAIRQADSTQRELAAKYGVCQSAIAAIVSRRSWMHLK